MSEVSLGHRDTCGTHRVCLHVTLSGGHLGGFTHNNPAWQTPSRHTTTRVAATWCACMSLLVGCTYVASHTTPQPGRHHTGIPQQAVPLQCCEYASRPLGLHYTRGDALADCRYCLPDVRGQPGSYRHLWPPQSVPACHSEWCSLMWLHTPPPSLADTTQASHNRQCHCSAVSRPQGLLACTTLELMH